LKLDCGGVVPPQLANIVGNSPSSHSFSWQAKCQSKEQCKEFPMNRKLIASLLLGAVIGISGAAQAENTIKGINVSEADWPRVQEKCTALVGAEKADNQVTSSTESSTESGTDSNSTDKSSDQVGSEMNADLATSIDLDTIVYQDCVDAGLVTTP
jgi:hypothetical protein